MQPTVQAVGLKSPVHSLNRIFVMALQLNYTHNGIAVENCYCRVSTVQGGKTTLTAEVSFHASSEHQAFYGKAVGFVPDMDGDNFIKQAYQYLKTLPEFSDAVDC